jgi:hypothetical protein
MAHVIRKSQQHKPAREPSQQQRQQLAVYPYRKCWVDTCTRPGVSPHWYCKQHVTLAISRPSPRVPDRFGGA